MLTGEQIRAIKKRISRELLFVAEKDPNLERVGINPNGHYRIEDKDGVGVIRMAPGMEQLATINIAHNGALAPQTLEKIRQIFEEISGEDYDKNILLLSPMKSSSADNRATSHESREASLA